MRIDSLLQFIKRFIPKRLFKLAAPFYHGALALAGAILYRFPARKLTVIGVTGTKGKSSTAEYLNAILEEAGHTTALIGTIRIKVANESKAEARHMTMPGRMTLQRTLRRAVDAGCDTAIIEISSEGAKQWRDRMLELNALIFTNLAPEHIESHGSFEKYAAAKLGIAKRLARSSKRPRTIVANADDAYGAQFLATAVEQQIPFSLTDAEPYTASATGCSFIFRNQQIHINFPGTFSIMNALAAASLAHSLGISTETIAHAYEKLQVIPGRAENVAKDSDIAVIVDYAHTPESLEALYQAYAPAPLVCVLGGTGGGRDTWKRPQMGAVAAQHCHRIILTNEDPYDEDPQNIINDVRGGIIGRSSEIVMDRHEAIHRAIIEARSGDTVLITGKGSNPSICGPNGTHTPWSDAAVAREALAQRTERSTQ